VPRVTARRPSLACHRNRGIGERGEDAASMEPARPRSAPKMGAPVKVSRLQLRDRRISTVGAAQPGADAETRSGKIQAIANRAANSIEGNHRTNS